jgi:hypothetical protein
MHMAVPKAGDDYLAGTIDHSDRFRNCHLAALSHRSDLAILYEYHAIVDRAGRRRWINPPTLQHESGTFKLAGDRDDGAQQECNGHQEAKPQFHRESPS